MVKIIEEISQIYQHCKAKLAELNAAIEAAKARESEARQKIAALEDREKSVAGREANITGRENQVRRVEDLLGREAALKNARQEFTRIREQAEAEIARDRKLNTDDRSTLEDAKKKLSDAQLALDREKTTYRETIMKEIREKFGVNS